MKQMVGIAILSALVTFQTARAGDFMDIRLSWVLAEDNFLADPGETPENSPGIGIGADERNTLFFDNYDTKYTGFETFGHLVLYKKTPAFFDDFYAEAALFLKVGNFVPEDESSYIKMIYDFSDGDGESNVELTLFPLSSDRFRLGYSYALSWGGARIFPLSDGLVPGARLQVNLPWAYAFLGFKTTRIEELVGDSQQTEMVTNYGSMAGGGIDIEGIVVEVNGGYFTRGTLPHSGVVGRHVYGSGVSYQVGYHQGVDIGTSIDFELYRNDPYLENLFFLPEEYDGGFSFLVKHEGTFLFQELADPDEYGVVTKQKAWAFDLNFAMKLGYLRVHMDAMIRSLSFLLFNEPSFTPFMDFPDEASTSPEYWAALGVDYHFPGPRLTPGIKFGFRMPATYKITDLFTGASAFVGKRTVVVSRKTYGHGTTDSRVQKYILPRDEDALLIWSIKTYLKWDYAEMLSVILELYYTWDDNQSHFVSDFYGLNIRSQFSDPNIIGLNLMAQARF